MNPEDPLYEQYQLVREAEMLYRLDNISNKLIIEKDKPQKAPIEYPSDKLAEDFNKYIFGGGGISNPSAISTPIPVVRDPLVIDIVVWPKGSGRPNIRRGTISWPLDERRLIGLKIDEVNITIISGFSVDEVLDELLALYINLCTRMSPDNTTWKNFFKNSIPDLEEKLKNRKPKKSIEEAYKSIYEVPSTYIAKVSDAVNWSLEY